MATQAHSTTAHAARQGVLLPDATRRALMLAPMLAPLAYATPAAAQPDADLIRLGKEYEALDATACALSDDLDACRAEAQAHSPPMPPVLAVSAQDRALFEHRIDGTSFGSAEVAKLRDKLPRLRRLAAANPDGGARYGLRRAEEVISAHESWCRACDARLAATRHGAVDKSYTEALAGCDAAADAILAAPATTTAGLQVKAKLAQVYLGRPGPEALLDERLVWSLLADVLALGELGAQRELAL